MTLVDIALLNAALAERDAAREENARLRARIHEAVDECQRRHAPYVKRCNRFDQLTRLAAHYWPDSPADGVADSDEKRPFGWESQVTQARVVQAMEAAVDAAREENARLRAAVAAEIAHPAMYDGYSCVPVYRLRAALAVPTADDGAERGAR